MNSKNCSLKQIKTHQTVSYHIYFEAWTPRTSSLPLNWKLISITQIQPGSLSLSIFPKGWVQTCFLILSGICGYTCRLCTCNLPYTRQTQELQKKKKASLISVGETSQIPAASGPAPGCSSCLETGNATACSIFKIKCNSSSAEYFCCLHTSTVKMKGTTLLFYSHDWGSLARECKFEVTPHLLQSRSITFSKAQSINQICLPIPSMHYIDALLNVATSILIYFFIISNALYTTMFYSSFNYHTPSSSTLCRD